MKAISTGKAKALSAVLAVLMLLTMFSVCAVAADDVNQSSIIGIIDGSEVNYFDTVTLTANFPEKPAAPVDGDVSYTAVGYSVANDCYGLFTTAGTATYLHNTLGAKELTVNIVKYVYDATNAVWAFSENLSVVYNYTVVGYTADADKNTIAGINEMESYKRYLDMPVTVTGDGMQNDRPFEGDTRFLPVAWDNGKQSGDFENGDTIILHHRHNGVYSLEVVFQEQVFTAGEWVNVVDAESLDVTDTKMVSYKIVSNNGWLPVISEIIPQIISFIMGLFK